MLSLITILSGLIVVVSLIAIIRPIPKLYLPTRGRALLVLLLASMVSGAAQNMKENEESGNWSKTRSSEKRAKKVVVPSDITFEEVDDKFGIEGSMTDLQKEEAWKSYKNKCIEWTGSLAHLDSGVFGGINIGMKHKSTTLTYDVLISAPESQKSRLMKWKEGDTYTYRGRLKRYGEILGIVNIDWGCR